MLKIENVFDVCFLRDEEQDTPDLVISANLRPEYREKDCEETIRIMEYQLDYHLLMKFQILNYPAKTRDWEEMDNP